MAGASGDTGMSNDSRYSNDYTEFRQQIRAVIRENLPDDIRQRVINGLYLHKDDFVRWQKILHAHGCFATGWPTEYGGPGWDLMQQYLFAQESALASAPPLIPYGVNMVGPVLIRFGTEAQKRTYLPGILSSDTWWCQGYSEPNAGSDLASLKCAAVREGDHYVINGSKIWTTQAHYADMMHALVRTADTGRKQEGITFLVLDMRTPGITIRPIITLDGVHHTNQVFFDNVRVPVENRIAEEGGGWKVAKFLLEHERAWIAETATKLRWLQDIDRQIESRFPAGGDMALAYRLRRAQLEIEVHSLIALEQRLLAQWQEGRKLPADSSALKVRATEIEQALSLLAMELRGPHTTAFSVETVLDENGMPEHPEIWQRASASSFQYMHSRACTIYGGSNEIQRGIISRAYLR